MSDLTLIEAKLRSCMKQLAEQADHPELVPILDRIVGQIELVRDLATPAPAPASSVESGASAGEPQSEFSLSMNSKAGLACFRDYALLSILERRGSVLVSVDRLLELLNRLSIGMPRASLVSKLNKWRSPLKYNNIDPEPYVKWIKNTNIDIEERGSVYLQALCHEISRDDRHKIDYVVDAILGAADANHDNVSPFPGRPVRR